ncbi:uncharacterized protein LOC127754778 [Oryza glaberrima]|uniref:uncharacterized protein LOC127754778 n=1 Tax=Oryza glaberrima TaxID=4538 RepID=UPI00224C07DC|nr:uncharacterized protein LOC127754778 [Oryza glaberrima]XP_052136326.1 uncharacterized protein LOC127754778 [Oryza glaberrima]
MDALMNRSRAFAEAVVIMVCPVLLAVALKKVDLKSQEHGRAVLIFMLVMAAFTLAFGTVPYLALSFSKRFSDHRWRLPAKATTLLAPSSCACLVGLACWIIHLILSARWAYAFPAMGAVFGLCIVVRTVSYCCRARGDPANLVAADERELPITRTALEDAMELERKLDESLELLAGVTALLFLALEGLALEGQINGGQRRLGAPMGVCFFACLFGVCFMLVEIIPPPTPSRNDTGCRASIVRNLAEICDAFMALAIGAVMLSIMIVLVKLLALLLLSPLFLMLLVHAFDVAVGRDGGRDGDGDNVKPASLEVSKVTFTGFLTVAISARTTSRGPLSTSTEWFLIFAASAIVSGFAWRLLTHAKVGKSANVASFSTHLCIVLATVPFTVMAGQALLH